MQETPEMSAIIGSQTLRSIVWRAALCVLLLLAYCSTVTSVEARQTLGRVSDLEQKAMTQSQSSATRRLKQAAAAAAAVAPAPAPLASRALDFEEFVSVSGTYFQVSVLRPQI